MALPADGRTDLSDLVTIGNAVSALMSPALKEAVIGFNLVHTEECPDDTNVIKFRKDGSFIAEAVTEGAVYTPTDANSDLNLSSVTATAVKYAVGSPITVEALRFGAGAAEFSNIATKHARALGRAFDDDLLSQFDGITATATATDTMNTDTLLEGQYKVYDGLLPPMPLVAVLDFKAVHELRKVAASSGAAMYSNSANLSIIGSPQPNNFVGNFLGIDVYQTTGLSTTGGDDQGCIFNPAYAFAAALGGAIKTEIRWTGHGVASQVAGFSYEVSSYIFWDMVTWNDEGACELRSDT